ncbi:Pr6Pr family membrane protein [Actinotalea ferrariae]|uniref:Pr6Pr family membrane protein n=1 Tax=Actinotalea ferrariae TaxID=1386098 RepID=UPI001C8B4F63|nr:Pr6Pr family membrane protein [Actinotalea ferrariae]MBX9244731.1 Pr6Pr family membrane protein [Actinotalea ferrariae]
MGTTLATDPPTTRVPPTAVTWLRLGACALVVAAVVATFLEAAGRTTVNPFNLFGYFTVQSNLLLALCYGVVAGAARTGRAPTWAVPARACVVTYVVVVGLVYVVLLAPLGAAGGVPVPWANVVLHVVTPLAGAVDWLAAPDRRRLTGRVVGLALVYPLVWCGVVLVRGATDGWVPYPFLDPAQGYATVAGYVAAIAACIAAVAALVVAGSRLPVVGGRPVDGPPPTA